MMTNFFPSFLCSFLCKKPKPLLHRFLLAKTTDNMSFANVATTGVIPGSIVNFAEGKNVGSPPSYDSKHVCTTEPSQVGGPAGTSNLPLHLLTIPLLLTHLHVAYLP